MKYNERLREVREDLDITQKEAAEAIGIRQQQLSKYETGEQEMTVSKLKDLCSYYKVSADYILGLKKGLKWYR